MRGLASKIVGISGGSAATANRKIGRYRERALFAKASRAGLRTNTRARLIRRGLPPGANCDSGNGQRGKRESMIDVCPWSKLYVVAAAALKAVSSSMKLLTGDPIGINALVPVMKNQAGKNTLPLS
jgi:hypothetical protein